MEDLSRDTTAIVRMSRAKLAGQPLRASLCLIALGWALRANPQSQQNAPEAAPPDAEQQQILEAARQYADDYIAKLPDFVCTQITFQFQAGRGGKHWHKDDTLTSKLVFNGGREERTLQLVNNKRIRENAPHVRMPLSTEGEFGLLLDKIFDPASEAKFSWVGWENIKGRRLAKFDYSIDLAHSTLSLTSYVKATVAYRGSICIDPATGDVWRATSSSSEIPEELQMKSIATTVDYDQVKIADQSYLLPVSATVFLVTNQDQVRNELQFVGYRKFEAESTISFGPESSDPAKVGNKPKPQR